MKLGGEAFAARTAVYDEIEAKVRAESAATTSIKDRRAPRWRPR